MRNCERMATVKITLHADNGSWEKLLLLRLVTSLLHLILFVFLYFKFCGFFFAVESQLNFCVDQFYGFSGNFGFSSCLIWIKTILCFCYIFAFHVHPCKKKSCFKNSCEEAYMLKLSAEIMKGSKYTRSYLEIFLIVSDIFSHDKNNIPIISNSSQNRSNIESLQLTSYPTFP